MNNTTNTQSAQPAAHTPGPRILQTDENDIFVEVVDSPTEGTVLATFTADEFGYANARLIAAAPELLAALRGLEDMASSVPEFTNLPAARAWLKDARAAITKAEGRA